MNDEMNTLLDRIRELEDRLARLEHSDDGITTMSVAATAPTATEQAEMVGRVTEGTLDRRQMLRRAGLVAAGAVAFGLASQDAAAAADGGNLIIGQSNTETSPTRLLAGTDPLASSVDYAAVVVGNSSPLVNGVASYGSNIGVGAFGPRLGLLVSSTTSHIQFTGNVATTTPNANLNRGELRVDANGDMWFQHTTGTGNAVKVTGPAAAGAFHAVDPWRAVDSRATTILASGTSRVVPITTGPGSVVPAGAKAIAATLTITGTQGASGWLTITAGDVATTGASSINWFGPDQNLAGTVISRLDSSGNIKMFNNSGNASHFILDVVGYYR